MTPKAQFQTLRDRLYTIRQRLKSYPNLHRVFLRTHGYPLQLLDPLTHSNRIVYKMLHDRDPLIPITSDKVRVRAYVRERLGQTLSDQILIPLYHISETGRDIPHSEWPQEFFMKANHGSRLNKLIQPGEDPKMVKQLAVQWLNTSYGQALHEWAYRDISRRILCEQVLRDAQRQIPMDIKFYCYQGKCKMVYYYKDRFTQPAQLITDETGRIFPYLLKEGVALMPETPQLDTYPQLLEIAEKLSQGFRFCRVDLYSVEGKIYFGELTQYDGAGMEKLQSYEVDLAEGLLWLPEYQSHSLWEVYEEVMRKAGKEICVAYGVYDQDQDPLTTQSIPE